MTGVFPPGGQRGGKFVAKLSGTNLKVARPEEMEILHRIPGAVRLTDFSNANETTVEISLNKDADVGLYPLRIRTPNGISSQVFISVGLFRDVMAAPAASTPLGQTITLPATISGYMRPAAQDAFVVQLAKGERLVAEVESRRLMIDVDPFLEVTDPAGKRVAWCDDAFGLGSDARVDFRAAVTGTYRVVLHDATFQKGGAYRLKLGDYPYAAGASPPIVVAGAKTELTFWGGSLPAGEKTVRACALTGSSGGWTVVPQPDFKSAALPIPIALAGTNGMPTGAAPLSKVFQSSGFLATSGPVAALRYSVKPQQRWRFELLAARIGSKLDGMLVVRDARGQDLAAAESAAGVDPSVEVTIPAGCQELVAYVEDTSARVGPEFYYHLRAQPAAANFSVELVNAKINVPAGGYELVRVRVQRRDFGGPIQLFLSPASSGVRADGGLIEAGETEGYLSLAAVPELVGKPVVEIAGRAGSPANPIDRVAELERAKLNRWCPSDLQSELPVAFTRPALVVVRPEKRRLTIIQGLPTDLKLIVERKPEAKDAAIELKAESPREFRDQIKDLKIAKDQSMATVRLQLRPEAAIGKRLLVIAGTSTLGAEQSPLAVPPIAVEVVRPFTVELLTPEIQLVRGGKSVVEGIVRRVQPFAGEIEIRADDLPRGLVAGPIKIAPDRAILQMPITATDIPDGVYKIKLTAVTAMGGQKRTKDYVLPPQELTIRVGGPKVSDMPAKKTRPNKPAKKAAAKKGA